ncbi:MAG: DUF6089 family protein [Prevotellaceae bacterium]|jgi:hypothetical protein|nr:DUF6089 family protein [Prevotellaceae bacterium]
MAQLARKKIFCVLAFFSSLVAGAQPLSYFRPEPHDIGMTAGSAFYLGDLTDNYSLFRNLTFLVGPFYRYHFDDRHSLRGEITFGELRGRMLRTDMPPDNAGEQWTFARSMIMMECAVEIGFLPMNVTDFRKRQRWSPYLVGGLGFTGLSPDKNIFVSEEEMQTLGGYLLLGVGAKLAIFTRFTLGAEWLMRKTFSDGLDYYKGKPGSWAINKDWIGTVGITFTYRLNEGRACAAYNRHEPLIFPLKGIRVEK